MIQAQRRAAMVQPMRRRRLGWGVLAVGALVASVLAAGAVPAGAVTDHADHTTRLSACVADAAEDRMFSDVSADHAFKDAINCIAYYRVTQGTGDGSTYSPNQKVTRAEMAVFVARAATAAGVALGSGIGGFNDIGGIWAEARDAIDGLASRGMIPSGGDFRPSDSITRAEMATFLVGLLAKAAPNVTIESSGAILLGATGSRAEADDYFADARASVHATNDAQISAIYELGVTKGASAAAVQDDSEPPLDFNYDPQGTVDRGQMAAFITRALAHTSVRPAGVTAQYDGAEVVVSVRDARYRPVPQAFVDVFWATTARADRALLANGACRLSAVTQADKSSYPCEIDDTDPVTGRYGDVRVSVAGLRRVPAGGAVVWAWTGQNEDTFDADADAFRLEVAEGAGERFATTTVVTTSFDAPKVPFGRAVAYSLQLTDPIGNVHRGVDGVEPAQWTLSVNVTGHSDAPEPPDDETVVSDSAGRAVFTVPFAGSFDDPNPAVSGDEFTVTFTLIPARNAPPGLATVDADGIRATTTTLIFSDEDPRIAAVTIDTPDYIHVSGREDITNRVTVTALDQYGSPFPDTQVRLRSSGAGVTLDRTDPADSDGSRQFSYRYSGTGRVTQTLTADASGTGTSRSATKIVYWTVDAAPTGDDKTVLSGDVRRGQIVVDDGGPVLLAYDRNDRFRLRGAPASMADFEAELAKDLRRATPSLSLSWSNYRPASTQFVTEIDLS